MALINTLTAVVDKAVGLEPDVDLLAKRRLRAQQEERRRGTATM